MNIANEYIEHRLAANIRRLVREGRRSLLPPPAMLVSEWADKNRQLPETSAEPGQWRTSRMESSRAVMNCVNKKEVRQITFMGSSQIAKTEIINNIIGYKIDLDPCAIMVMQPTEKDARDYVQLKLEPMLEDTVCLRKKVAKKKSRDADNSMFRKKFIGGWIIIVSGNSPSATRSRSAKLTIGDDIDAIPIAFQREGDPILRLIKRSTTFPDSLNINISTPTRYGESRIETLYEQSNKQKIFVKCLHCEAEQLLLEENLYWEKEFDMFGKVLRHFPETARYACAECGVLLTEQERLTMLQHHARWIAERPWIIEHEGFFLNELSSQISSMKKVVDQIRNAGLDIKDGKFDFSDAHEEKVEALFNTVFGRTYQPIRGESIEAIELLDRVEDYITKEDKKIPDDVQLLTTSIDVQEGMRGAAQRLEINVWGWGEKEEGWLIFRDNFPGNIKDLNSENSPWKRLEEFFKLTWKRKDGVELGQVVKMIDAGYETQTVYDFTAGRIREGIYAIKGASRYGADLLPRKLSPVNKGKSVLIVIGTQAAKAEIYGRLKNIKTPGARYIHYPRCYCDATYFKQYAAEQAVRKFTQYAEYIIFEKIKKQDANEAIDLHVYAYCGMKLLNPNWLRLKETNKRKSLQINQEQLFESSAAPVEKKQPQVFRRPVKNFASSW